MSRYLKWRIWSIQVCIGHPRRTTVFNACDIELNNSVMFLEQTTGTEHINMQLLDHKCIRLNIPHQSFCLGTLPAFHVRDIDSTRECRAVKHLSMEKDLNTMRDGVGRVFTCYTSGTEYIALSKSATSTSSRKRVIRNSR